MLRLGSIGRTTIDVDGSFIILVGLWVALSYNPAQGIHYALLWAPVLFVSILFHELAHAAANAALGFGASEIVLGGMGGFTRNERRARPWQDFIVSVAGPLSNFALMFIVAALHRNFEVMSSDKMLRALVPYMIGANLWWGVLNLIPVPPLDGGHATRSFFRMILPERPAFVIAVWIAIAGGGAIAIYAAIAGQFFVALMVGWFAFQNYQAWQYFREHGIPGD